MNHFPTYTVSCNIIYTIQVWYSDIPCQSFPHLPSPYSFGSMVQWFSSVRTAVQCIQAKYQTGTELPPNYTQTEPMVQFNLVWFRSGSQFKPVRIWTVTSLASTPSVTLTLYHKPLPDVPVEDYSHSLVTDMIIHNLDLFEVVTPIHLNVLVELTKSHPNWNFVTSILWGFCEGFWSSALLEHLLSKPEGHDNC